MRVRLRNVSELIQMMRYLMPYEIDYDTCQSIIKQIDGKKYTRILSLGEEELKRGFVTISILGKNYGLPAHFFIECEESNKNESVRDSVRRLLQDEEYPRLNSKL